MLDGLVSTHCLVLQAKLVCKSFSRSNTSFYVGQREQVSECWRQMSTDFAPVFQKKFHDRVIHGLLHLMDDAANPRVQAHAGKASLRPTEALLPSK
jgi:hypothetical protein